MLQLVQVQVESALFFESTEEIYARVFRNLKPRTPLPRISVRFRQYANANSRVRLQDGELRVEISDVLQAAPAPIQEALASILIGKLFRKELDANALAKYRHYLNRADVRRSVQAIRQQRGRKAIREPQGRFYDLREIFEDLNFRYFSGLMAQPGLGWSMRPSRTTLGHYDPCHHVIVLSSLLDSAEAPALAVRYVTFHEMLHLRFPTEHRGARRCVHTRAFKAAERMFEDYRKARLELRQFVESFSSD